MKFLAPTIAVLAAVSMASAKPPGVAPKEPARKPPAISSPTTESAADAALARWLAQAPSGQDAFAVPFAPLASAVSGKRISAFDPGIPADAAALAKIGGALDALLPKMNQPDSLARIASATGGPEAVATAYEGELRSPLASPPLTADARPEDHAYPRLSFADPASSKTYYLAISLYPTGGDPASDALVIRPDLAARRITSDGCCLFVAIEHNGKPGKDIAFLNWQIIDLAKVTWRFVPTFATGGPGSHPPGAMLTDGRKGRD